LVGTGRGAQASALNWVDVRNDVRSAVASGGVTIPWYSNPDFGRDPAVDVREWRLHWAAGLLHDRALGVDTMLFWSDRAWTADELRFGRPIIAYLQRMPVPARTVVGKLDAQQAEAAMSPWVALARTLTEPGAVAQ
jgi:hypothetical protein